MPLTRNQKTAGLTDLAFQRPSPAQLKTQLQSLDLSSYVALGSYPASSTLTSAQGSATSTIHVHELLDNPSSLLPGNTSLAENLNLLLLHHWIRVFVAQNATRTRRALRIYVLPDDVGQWLIVRDSAKLRSALRGIIASIDCTSEAWDLGSQPGFNHSSTSYIAAAEAADSLYYLFNNVSAPIADPEKLDKDANYYAMKDILQNPMELGLLTEPYEYQLQSAATMLSREAEPKSHIDPRFEEKTGPTGEVFYLDTVEGSIFKAAKYIEDVRGGILAENMGAGKTLISIILVLATRGHLPKLPDSSIDTANFVDKKHGAGSRSLKETTSRALYLHAIPYRPFLEKEADTLLRYVDQMPAYYGLSTGSTIHLSSTTLIVVPPNLISHWSDELRKHVNSYTLAVYTALNDGTSLPEALELIKYDVILISKPRFEDEFSPRQSLKRQRTDDEHDDGTGGLVCVCSKKRRACAMHTYTTPLAQLHFLRVVVDEALGFSKSSFDNKASAAIEKLKAERKWLVSGTPSKGLRGVEIDVAMQQDPNHAQIQHEEQTLQNRRARPSLETEEDHIKRFGHIVTNFFHAKPWYGKGGAIKVAWTRYMIPDKYGKGKPGNLKAVVESLVVRHQMHQVDEEVRLPPLSNKVVYLDACPVDKMALNLFTVQLIFNAVTSEREDQDYMFHPSQKKHLASLFQNLRHANFYWTGHEQTDLLKSIETAERYLAKGNTQASAEDRTLLTAAIQIGRKTLGNPQWQAASSSKEMAMFVESFPEHLQPKYAMTSTGYRNPLMMSATHVRQTQEVVASRLYAQEPFYTLWRSAGDEVWRSLIRTPETGPGKKRKAAAVKGVSSAIYATNDTSTPPKRRKSNEKPTEEIVSLLPPIPTPPKLKSALKCGSMRAALPEKYGEVSKPYLVATASSKLSYLIDNIMKVYKDEKIIVFYEDANIGFWLAQALEVLEVHHEIYAFGIKEGLRTQYLQEFENGEHIRVLLMDLRLGSHGLHLASVTRVFFVNPVWDETVEAQAIKRAHRTGQTKPVFIETLVLKGTLEDQMLRRRKNMTTQELHQTSKGPTADPAIHEMIKNAGFLTMSEEEWKIERMQCAPLEQRYQLYGREFIGHPALRAAPQATTPAAIPSRVMTIKISNLPRRPSESLHDRAKSASPSRRPFKKPVRPVYSASTTPPSGAKVDTVPEIQESSSLAASRSLTDRQGFLALLTKLRDIPVERRHTYEREKTSDSQLLQHQVVAPIEMRSTTRWKRSIDDIDETVVQSPPKKKKKISWIS